MVHSSLTAHDSKGHASLIKTLAATLSFKRQQTDDLDTKLCLDLPGHGTS